MTVNSPDDIPRTPVISLRGRYSSTQPGTRKCRSVLLIVIVLCALFSAPVQPRFLACTGASIELVLAVGGLVARLELEFGPLEPLGATRTLHRCIGQGKSKGGK